MPFPSIAIVIAKLFCLLFFISILSLKSALHSLEIKPTPIPTFAFLTTYVPLLGERKLRVPPGVDKLFCASPMRLWDRKPCVWTLVCCAAKTRAKTAPCSAFQGASLGGALGKDSDPNNCALVNVMSQPREQGVKTILDSSEQSKRKEKGQN